MSKVRTIPTPYIQKQVKDIYKQGSGEISMLLWSFPNRVHNSSSCLCHQSSAGPDLPSKMLPWRDPTFQFDCCWKGKVWLPSCFLWWRECFLMGKSVSAKIFYAFLFLERLPFPKPWEAISLYDGTEENRSTFMKGSLWRRKHSCFKTVHISMLVFL